MITSLFDIELAILEIWFDQYIGILSTACIKVSNFLSLLGCGYKGLCDFLTFRKAEITS